MKGIIILFFGLFLRLSTNRLSNLARILGKSVGEFQRTRKRVKNEIARVNKPISAPVGREREKLETIVRALQMETDGSTDDELKRPISDRINNPASKTVCSSGNKQLSKFPILLKSKGFKYQVG